MDKEGKMNDLKTEMEHLRIRSGGAAYEDNLTSFLYELMRDHLPPGKVEQIVQNSLQQGDRTENGTVKTVYSNGWLARYANDISERLKQ